MILRRPTAYAVCVAFTPSSLHRAPNRSDLDAELAFSSVDFRSPAKFPASSAYLLDPSNPLSSGQLRPAGALCAWRRAWPKLGAR